MNPLENVARKLDHVDQRGSASEHPRQSWPQGVSLVPVMRISDVLNALKIEFPAVTHSKLRFLEEQGFIVPMRTPAGYRQYSSHDLERLRFVLTEQRDRYLPLKVIKEKLEVLDQGSLRSDSPLGPRIIATDGLTGAQSVRERLQDLSEVADVSPSFVDELYKAGVLREQTRNGSDAERAMLLQFDADIVRLAAELAPYGIDWRHLRSLRAAADRSIALIEQSVAPIENKKTDSSSAQARATKSEIGEILAQLHTVWLRAGIAESDS